MMAGQVAEVSRAEASLRGSEPPKPTPGWRPRRRRLTSGPAGPRAARFGLPGAVLDDHARAHRPARAGADPQALGKIPRLARAVDQAAQADRWGAGRDAGADLRVAPRRAGRGRPGRRAGRQAAAVLRPRTAADHRRPGCRSGCSFPRPRRRTPTGWCWRPCTTPSSTPVRRPPHRHRQRRPGGTTVRRRRRRPRLGPCRRPAMSSGPADHARARSRDRRHPRRDQRAW